MKVLSIQVTDQLKKITFKDKEWETAIWKSQVSGPIFLDKLGLNGDRQANLNVHGGEGRALYVFGRKTYELWSDVIQKDLLQQNGLFGENLTLEEIDESTIHVGDQFELGETIIEATMPRFPCPIFAGRVGFASAADFMFKSEKPGVLFRVLKTGLIKENDQLRLIKKSEHDLSMPHFLKMGQIHTINRQFIDYLKTISAVPQITIDRLEYRLVHGR